ncbi:MAG: glycosyltransferase [Dysgonamonadaceae bacterium]|nr:glycosyltransferase [Dysgonamonadaceae bacterium]
MRKKILFIGHISNAKLREHLELRSFSCENKFREFLGFIQVQIFDVGAWNTVFCDIFSRHGEYEFYVVSFHYGMKKKIQRFDENGVHYIFLKQNLSLIQIIINKFTHYVEKNDYKNYQRKVLQAITGIDPVLVILCGAENPIYSASVLDIPKKPIFVIIQTLLSSKKRIEMNVGSEYRRDVEKRIIKHANYFGTNDNEEINYIKSINPKAKIYSFVFPTFIPPLYNNEKKESDFVFYARGISKFKGIEDALDAFAIVKQQHPHIIMNVIGSCSLSYLDILKKKCDNLNILNNVNFCGFFNSMEDAFRQVQKSRCILVPGITASLNSTIREGMFMRIPTVCYETEATKIINKDNKCLFTAITGDVPGLASQMRFVINNVSDVSRIVSNALEYAQTHFGINAVEASLMDTIHSVLND